MSKTETKPTSISAKLTQLDQAVEWFYGDKFSLDQALKKYKDTAKLATEIEQDLAKLKNEVEVLQDFTKS